MATIDGTPDDDTLVGTSGDDTINGFDGNDVLQGREGNDTLDGGAGSDYLDGGGASDTASYEHSAGPVEVDLQFGSGQEYASDGFTLLSIDTLVSIENATGSAFDDFLLGSNADNILDGQAGNDLLLGRGGNDTLYGGDGDDLVRGDAGDDQLFGGDGNDNLRGGAGIDSYDGGSNTEDLNPISSYGDRVSFYDRAATQGAVADLRTGTISNDGFGNVETMVGIESLGGGTAFVDTFYGNDSRNALFADRGDYLYAFGGDDILQLGSAGAVVDGGSGTDLLQLYSNTGWLMPDTNGDGLAEVAPAAAAGWNANLATGTLVDGYGNSGTVTGVENVDGSELGDTIIGDGNANVLNGLNGNDSLNGGRGNDILSGGQGDDTLTGSQGADQFVIEASSGNDHITDFGPKMDKVVFDPSSGVTDFSQLTLTKVGNDIVITWGTGDSLTLDGVKPKDLHASDFQFGAAFATAESSSVVHPDSSESLQHISPEAPADYFF